MSLAAMTPHVDERGLTTFAKIVCLVGKRAFLLCLIAFSIHMFLNCSYSRAEEKEFPAGNDLFVIGMVDLDQIDKCGVNVMGWFGGVERPEQRKWMGKCVEFAKQRGIPLIMSLSIFDASWDTYQQRPDLVAACCIDIEGNPIIVDWETQSPDKPMYWGCTNNPTYRQFWIEVARNNVDLGAQGIIADEMQGTSGVIWHDGGCYCDYCEKGFREFLRKKRDAKALKKQGIDDLDAFSYANFIRSKVSTRREEVMEAVRRKKAPLIQEYERFQRLASRDYLEQLVRETKAYAREKHRRTITFSANTFDLAPSTWYYLDLLDYFSVETPYVKRYQYPPHRRVLPYFRISEALGKPSVALLSIHCGADFNKRGRLPNLQRLHIAEAYASGNNTFLPDGVYAWSKESGPDRYIGDLDTMAPVCRFVRGSDLYDGSHRWGAEIALLYLTASALRSWHYWNSFAGACWVLDDAHLPFDVVISGDGELVKRKLALADLQPYDAIVLTEDAWPSEHEVTVLQNYIQAGGRALWLGGDRNHPLAAAGVKITQDVGARRFAKERPDGAAQVLQLLEEAAGKKFEFDGPSRCTALPRILPNGSIVVHFLNFDYDVDADSFRTAGPMSLRIKPDRDFMQPKAAFLTPRPTGARELAVRRNDGWLEVDAPEVDVYAVLLVGEEGAVAESAKKIAHVVSQPLAQPKRVKIDRDDHDWDTVPANLPNGVKAVLDVDGLYFYVPSEDPRAFRSVVFEIDLNGDDVPDMGYYGDRWGGAVSKYGPQSTYMGRGRAAPCERGMEFKVPGSALPELRRLRVRIARLDGEKRQSAWVVVEKADSAQ